MVLSRLQNLANGHQQFNPSPSPGPDFNAFLASLSGSGVGVPFAQFYPPAANTPGGSGGAGMGGPPPGPGPADLNLPRQPPAYVSASQVHPPPPDLPAAQNACEIISSSAADTPDNDHDADAEQRRAVTSASKAKGKEGVKNEAQAASADANPSSSSATGPAAASTSASGSAPGQGGSINKQIPAFLNKLRNMVDDKETDNLICWQPDGKTFIGESVGGVLASIHSARRS